MNPISKLEATVIGTVKDVYPLSETSKGKNSKRFTVEVDHFGNSKPSSVYISSFDDNATKCEKLLEPGCVVVCQCNLRQKYDSSKKQWIWNFNLSSISVLTAKAMNSLLGNIQEKEPERPEKEEKKQEKVVAKKVEDDTIEEPQEEVAVDETIDHSKLLQGLSNSSDDKDTGDNEEAVQECDKSEDSFIDFKKEKENEQEEKEESNQEQEECVRDEAGDVGEELQVGTSEHEKDEEVEKEKSEAPDFASLFGDAFGS